MNFDLSDEQAMLQDAVKQYLENECPLDRLREIYDGDTGHEPVLWKPGAVLDNTNHVDSNFYGIVDIQSYKQRGCDELSAD